MKTIKKRPESYDPSLLAVRGSHNFYFLYFAGTVLQQGKHDD